MGLLKDTLSRGIQDAPTRALAENTLGTALIDQYQLSADPAVLDRAVQALEDAVRLMPPRGPHQAAFLNNLAFAYTIRFEARGSKVDLEHAVGAYHSACDSAATSTPEMRLRAARGWAALASRQQVWEQVLEASAAAFEALQALDRTNTLLRDRQNWHREARGIVVMAAYAFARLGRLEKAVETIELNWASHLHDRLMRDVAVRDLATLGGGLAHRYISEVSRLRALEAEEVQATLQPSDDAPPPNLQELRLRYRKTLAELGRVVDEVRRVDGFERFLMPPDYSQIASAVRPGEALVYLVVGRIGSLGLIIHRGRAQHQGVRLEAVWLDECTAALVESTLVGQVGSTPRGYLPALGAARLDHAALDHAITHDLAALGRSLLAPLAARLRVLEVDRLTLIPAGPLKLVPLAGIALDDGGRPRCLLDEWTVSFVPSARAFAYARKKAQERASESSTLTAIANPKPSQSYDELWFAEDEARAVATHFETARVLVNEQATLEAAIDAFPGATHVHFACHGIFASANPHLSLLLLAHDKTLLLYNVIYNATIPNARLVVLSACETGVSALDQMPEEWVGFPTGFLLAGVPGVVGSLWKVNDASTARLMGEFYRLHLKSDSHLEPAEALRRAQLWLRDCTPFTSPVHWAAFAHFGV